jgi:hypothetical protein
MRHIDLYQQLGLRKPRIEGLDEFLMGIAPPREYQDLGTVVLYSGYEAATSPTIKVEAVSVSAVFWRFTIDRPVEGSDERELLEVTTGSGTLEEYWPGVRAVAENCFTVKVL